MSAELGYTPLEEIRQIHSWVSNAFKSGITRPLPYRRKQLIQLLRMVKEHQAEFEEALHSDLGKTRLEAISFELIPIMEMILNAIDKLEEWTTPQKPAVEEWKSTWDTTVYRVPKGASLIIAAWNHPVGVALNPLVGAISAGCPAVVKMADQSPASAALVGRLLPRYLDTQAYGVVLGAVEETTTLLDLQWGHIFFTGGITIGRIVAAAAAKNVTPLTLELGGKSPVIISPDCDIKLAAKRVLHGKVQNTGQICVSPDYVLLPRSVASEFYEAIKHYYAEFFPTDVLAPGYLWSKIVNARHYKRVKNLLDTTKGTIMLGGKGDGVRLEPTVVKDVELDDPLMQEEIFGPVLAIHEVEDVDEAISIVADRPHPLVLYAFTNDEELKEKLLNKTNSGTLALNDPISQLAVFEMPFGGHGNSGYGAYFGKAGFDTFTHLRSYTNIRPEMESFFKYRYHPYTEEKLKVMTAGANIEIPEE